MAEKVTLAIRNEKGVTEKIRFETCMKFVVGRSQECAWRIPSAVVSRRHCLFDIDPPYVSVRDLNSLNGTYVNGERLRGSRVLADKDTVQIGEVLWTVERRETADVQRDACALEPVGV